MEDRCLLAGYSVTNMVFPGGYMYVDSAINNLAQVAGRGVVPGVMDHAVVWQNGSIIDLDPQQLHGTSYAIDLTNPAQPERRPGRRRCRQRRCLPLGRRDHVRHRDLAYAPITAAGRSRSVTPAWWPVVITPAEIPARITPSSGPTGNHNHVLDQGELQDLNSVIPTATVSAAEDIIDASGRGDHRKVVADAYVTVQGGGQQWRAFLLTDHERQRGVRFRVEVADLGTLPGAVETQASAINDVGQVAGYSGAQRVPLAERCHDESRPVEQGDSRPPAINHGGQVVGHAFGSSGGQESAWIWTGSGKHQGPQRPDPHELGVDLV